MGQAVWWVGLRRDTAGQAKGSVRLELERSPRYVLLVDVWGLRAKGELLCSTVSEGCVRCSGGRKQSGAVRWTNQSMKRCGWERARCLIWSGVPNGLKQPIEFLCLKQIPAKETFYDALIGSLGFLEQGSSQHRMFFPLQGLHVFCCALGFVLFSTQTCPDSSPIQVCIGGTISSQ